MKKSSATMYSPTSLDLPLITKTLPRRLKHTQTKKQTDPKPGSTPQPTDETVTQLNQIGREYPFCVYYKQKRNDPL
jgi:hypothetical protein